MAPGPPFIGSDIYRSSCVAALHRTEVAQHIAPWAVRRLNIASDVDRLLGESRYNPAPAAQLATRVDTMSGTFAEAP